MITKTAHLQLAPERTDGPVVSELIMGINLEMAGFISSALLSNRVRNGKFAGPPNAQTGIAPEWQPFGNNMGGMHAKTIEGMFMSPSQCQMLHCYSGPYGAGLVQSGIPIRKGETLEFKMWAKARHRPVRIAIALRAAPTRAEDGYANAEFVVDTSYWKCFHVSLPIPQTDDNAVLFVLLKETGVILIDQITLEPAGSTGVDLDVQEAILRLNPSAIRFPGGCMSTNYHWRMGLGPRELRPALADPVFKTQTDYDFGPDDYLDLCRILGNTPHITVNVGSGTPDDATAWAAYCQEWYLTRGIESPLAYFQIGNEQYGPWETSHMTADMYVDVLKEFVPGIRKAYPNCRIIALAEPLSTGIAGDPDTPLRSAVLTEAQGYFDVLAINRYKGQWYDDPRDQLQNAVDSAGKIRHELELLASDSLAAGWTPRIALTEWNFWLHAAHWDGRNFFEPDDAFHGIFFANVIHTLARMSEVVEVASYYHLLNAMGLVVKGRNHVIETAIGTLYRLYRSALPGRLVTLRDDHSGVPGLDSLAIEHSGTISLFLIHWNMEETTKVALDPSFGSVASSQTLAATDAYSAMKARPSQFEDGEIALPPLSVTRIDFSRDA